MARWPAFAASLLLVLACQPRGERAETIPPEPVQAPPMSAPASAPEAPQVEARERPPGVIYRSELNRATKRGPGWLLRELAPEPYRPTGRFQGWRITQIFPDDPTLCDPGCDLAVGDIIINVNGSSLQRPEQLAQLFEKLPSLREVTVHRVREGKGEKIKYQIVED